MTKLELAKQLIREYCEREFGDATVDFSRIDKVPIGFTTSEDEEHTIQIYANLRDCRIDTYIDDELAETEEHTMDEMLESVLPYLEFDLLVGYDSVGELIADAAARCEASKNSCAVELDGGKEFV